MKHTTVFNFTNDRSSVTQQSVQSVQIAVCKETGPTTQSLTTYISFPPMRNFSSSYTRIEVRPSPESVNISVKIDNQPMQTVQIMQEVQEVPPLPLMPLMQEVQEVPPLPPLPPLPLMQAVQELQVVPQLQIMGTLQRVLPKLPPLPPNRQESIKEIIRIAQYENQKTIVGNPHNDFNIEKLHDEYGNICYGHPHATAGFNFYSLPFDYIPLPDIYRFIKVNPDLWTSKTYDYLCRFGDPYATLVVKGLYLGSVYHLNKDYLSYLGVNYVVSAIESKYFPKNLEEIASFSTLDSEPDTANTINLYHLEITDDGTQASKQTLGSVLDIIVTKLHQNIENGTICLVHCHYGISRSATIVAAYLIKYKNFTVLEAIKYLRSHRPQVSPKSNFKMLLTEYAQSLQA
jgi:predicted protein tyrosine phosphatase